MIGEALYESRTPQEVVAMLPNDLHDKLKVLIAKIINYHLPEWRESAIQTQPSLPKLREMDWRVDLTTASDQMMRMNVPSVVVQLKVEGARTHVDQPDNTQNITFELNRESLETILEGLGQIRDQLSTIG